jgi:hypothetical protein
MSQLPLRRQSGGHCVDSQLHVEGGDYSRAEAPTNKIMSTTSKKRRTKALEKVARAVHDSDEFVEHVSGIARGFAAHHELDAGAGTRGVRHALKAFERHATALLEWLERSNERGSAECEALNTIRAAFQDIGAPYVDSTPTITWLRDARRASNKADVRLQGKKLKNAPRFAAEALRATFEHHRLKVSHQVNEKKQSDAVKLLCAIAKDGGDSSMTPMQAREWLIQTARA